VVTDACFFVLQGELHIIVGPVGAGKVIICLSFYVSMLHVGVWSVRWFTFSSVDVLVSGIVFVSQTRDFALFHHQ